MALKCDVSNEGVKILCEGGIDDMVGDLMALINSLYSSLLQSNTVGANFFKYAMTHAVSDSISPLWVPRKNADGDLTINIPVEPFDNT